MQLNKPQHGSMGIPPEIKAAGDKARDQVNKKIEKDFGFGKEMPKELLKEEPVEVTEPTGEEFNVDELSPLKMLGRIGVKFTEEDFTAILFKGVFVTDVDIVRCPGKNKEIALAATIKTLTGTEYDIVDELIAEESDRIKMTNDGFVSRRSMLIIATGVTHLQGKPLVKLTDKRELRDIILDRKKILSELSPAVLNRLIQLHGTITTAINLIVSKPDDHLKNL